MKEGLLAIVICLGIMACGDGNVRVEVDPEIQAEEDSIKIMEYLFMEGYTDDEIGSTENGVRYVILDSGSMELIDESDFVDFNYIGITLGDTIFDTSIQEIGDSLELFYEENPFILDGDTVSLFTRDNDEYFPFSMTYSASGWSIELSLPGLIPGFIEGTAATFQHISEDGSVLILIPSQLAYGSTGQGVFIEPNQPIAFELRPETVNKQ